MYVILKKTFRLENLKGKCGLNLHTPFEDNCRAFQAHPLGKFYWITIKRMVVIQMRTSKYYGLSLMNNDRLRHPNPIGPS